MLAVQKVNNGDAIVAGPLKGTRDKFLNMLAQVFTRGYISGIYTRWNKVCSSKAEQNNSKFESRKFNSTS